MFCFYSWDSTNKRWIKPCPWKARKVSKSNAGTHSTLAASRGKSRFTRSWAHGANAATAFATKCPWRSTSFRYFHLYEYEFCRFSIKTTNNDVSYDEGLDDFTPVSPSLNLLQPFKLESNTNGWVRLLLHLISSKLKSHFIIGLTSQKNSDVKVVEQVAVKPRGLEDLDVLGEALMKQNLPVSAKHQSSFQKPVERVPLNELARKRAQSEVISATQEVQPVSNLPRTFIAYIL